MVVRGVMYRGGDNIGGSILLMASRNNDDSNIGLLATSGTAVLMAVDNNGDNFVLWVVDGGGNDNVVLRVVCWRLRPSICGNLNTTNDEEQEFDVNKRYK